jgi:hypothetical protein
MGYEVKLLLAAALFGFAGSPLLAQATETSLPWYADLGVCGLLGSIVWWLIAKTIPKMTDDLKTTCGDLGDKFEKGMDGVKAEIRAGNDSQLALLRANLHQNQRNQEGGS